MQGVVRVEWEYQTEWNFGVFLPDLLRAWDMKAMFAAFLFTQNGKPDRKPTIWALIYMCNYKI